jgi:hypothetical protein
MYVKGDAHIVILWTLKANYDSVKYDKKLCIHFLNTDKQELITEYFLHVYLSKEITNKKYIYTERERER